MKYWSGLKYSPYDAYLHHMIDFIFVWIGEPDSCFLFVLDDRYFISNEKKKVINKSG